MATTTTPKSILKKPSYPATNTSKEARDREVAIYHARLIQERKDIEFEILMSMETLMDYPLATSPYDASNPSPTDATTFKILLRPFQPNDYDALIVERNINERCGYTLCPKPRLKEKGGGYRLLGTSGKAKDFKVVKKEELEKWCSEACARRALYVKVQLSERPAWERDGSQSNIDLLDEPKSEEGAMVDGLEKLQLNEAEGQPSNRDFGNLALERGDAGRAARNGLVEVMVKEKNTQRPPQAPSLDDAELSERLENTHLRLEGYMPNFSRSKVGNEENEDLDMD